MKIIEGFLEIPLRGGKTHLVEELSCSSYEIFMKSWILMLSLNQLQADEHGSELSFFELLSTDARFRECVVTCLELLGLENPLDILTPRQVKALFINAVEDGGDGVGYIFKLHGSSPKVSLRQRTVEKSPSGRSSFSTNSQSLTEHVSPLKKLWVTALWWRDYLYLGYCGSEHLIAI